MNKHKSALSKNFRPHKKQDKLTNVGLKDFTWGSKNGPPKTLFPYNTIKGEWIITTGPKKQKLIRWKRKSKLYSLQRGFSF